MFSFATDLSTGVFKHVPGLFIVPLEKGINQAGKFIGTSASGFQSAKDLSNENEELKKQIELLKTDNQRLMQIEEEALRMKELLQMKDKYPDYTYIGANVIAKSDGNWFSSFTIDKGSQDGIAKDMNVIAQGGLVGIIADVGLSWATVRTIIDDTSAVSGLIQGPDAHCILSGDLTTMDQNMIPIKNIVDNKKAAKVGDTVITSQISTKFLPGLLIGTIKSIDEDPNNLTRSGFVTPVVDFNKIDEVLIIQDTKKGEQ